MRIISLLILVLLNIEAIQYSVVSPEERDRQKRYTKGTFSPKVSTKVSTNRINQARKSLPIHVTAAPQKSSPQNTPQLPVQVKPARPKENSTPNYPLHYQVTPPPRSMHAPLPPTLPIEVISASREPQAPFQQPLDVRVYPPTLGNTSRGGGQIRVDVGASRPITQEMMFYSIPQPKMQIPVRKKTPPSPPAPPPEPEPEYDDNDRVSLFERNRQGVMLGFGIGGAFDRLWVGGNGGNHRFYTDSFTWYFRLGYQHYFTPYLGLRAYVHLGDWSNKLSQSFYDQAEKREVKILSSADLNYSGYLELLYDFVVLENHSFGLFGGFGIGVGTYEFSNDDTKTLSDYFVMPMFSAGFAYTLFLNNRFELEVKAPLRQGILQKSYRAEFSTWMLGISYTYVF